MNTTNHTTSASAHHAAWGSLQHLGEAIAKALEWHNSGEPLEPVAMGDDLTAEALARQAALTIGQGRRVKMRTLSDWECEEQGLPEGTTEPCVYAFPIANGQPGRWDAWDDGECFHVDALGWTLEVHHEARSTQCGAHLGFS
jgi:hypothetical protein